MLIRSLVIAAALACLTGFLCVAQTPPLGMGGGAEFPLMGLAGIGLLTLRSEAHRLAPRRS